MRCNAGIDDDIKIWEPKAFEEDLADDEREELVAHSMDVCARNSRKVDQSTFLRALLPYMASMRCARAASVATTLQTRQGCKALTAACTPSSACSLPGMGCECVLV